MKIALIVIGKTDQAYLKEGMANYIKRLGHYTNFEYKEIPDIKNRKKLSENQIKELEGKSIIQECSTGDHVVLFDENGKEFNSRQFSKHIDNKGIQGVKRLVFIIGGAYGFSENVYTFSKEKHALSKMTFSHQMVRLFALEQLYRAHSIIKGEPYHHD